MSYYRVQVKIESNDGEELTLETYRYFTRDSKVPIFASGFADGFAMSHSGVVLDTKIEPVPWFTP
jgi:hypothetical protein